MVTVSYNTSLERYIISVEGHANYGPEGQDTVCAAISVLTFTLFRALAELDSRGAFSRFYHSLSKGSAQFDFTVKPPFALQVKAAVEALFEGFFLLEENYPDCVCVE